MRSDQLQNELLTISHHLDDMEESLRSKDVKYAMMGLKDVREAVDRMSKWLGPNQSAEIERMAEGIDPNCPDVFFG